MRDSASHLISLLGVKIAMNLRAEATKNQLGYAWWLLEPILETAVFYLVFGIFLSGGTENFIAFLLTGLIPWTWFSRSVSNSMMSLKNASWLLNNFRLNPVFFPLVELGQDAFKQLATFGFLLSFLFLYGVEPADSWIWLPGVMLLQMLLVASIGCCVAAFIPLLVCLRLAAVLHRRREEIEQKELPELTVSGNTYILKFPRGWLHNHPLTLASFEIEREQYDRIGVGLEFS